MGVVHVAALAATLAFACTSCAAQVQRTIKSVATPTEFQKAIQDQVPHVVLTNHLSMLSSNSETDGAGASHAAAIAVQDATKSIVGRCSTQPPPDFMLSEALPLGACAVIVTGAFIEIGRGVRSLWIHGLYVVIEPSTPPTADVATIILQKDGDLWLTGSVLQGRGAPIRAIDVSASDGGSPRLYTAADVAIVDMDGCDMPGVRCGVRAACLLNGTAFRHDAITGGEKCCGSAVGVLSNGAAWLQDLKVTDDTAESKPPGACAIARDWSAEVFADPQMDVWIRDLPEAALSAPIGPAALERFAFAGTALFNIKQEQRVLEATMDQQGLDTEESTSDGVPPDPTPRPPDTAIGPGDSIKHTRVLEIALASIAAVLGLVVLAVGAVLIYAILYRSRRGSTASPQGSFKIARRQPQRGTGHHIPESVDGANLPLAGRNVSSSYPALIHTAPSHSLSHRSMTMSSHSDAPPVPPVDGGQECISAAPQLASALRSAPSNRLYRASPPTTGGSAAASTTALPPLSAQNTALVRSYSSHSYPAILPWTGGRQNSFGYPNHSSGALPQLQSEGARSSLQGAPESGASGRSFTHAAGPGPMRPASAAGQPSSFDRNGSVGTLMLPLLPPEGDTHTTTFDTTAAPPLPPPVPGADGYAVLDRPLLEHALDNMHACGELFMGKFDILGPLERRAGGQGIVQFALSRPNGEPVAIKFFMNRKAFDCEDALYDQQRLRSMMPAVTLIHSNDDASLMTHEGWFFPPCIVVERGESLDEWRAHVQPDFCTVLQVLMHVTERVSTLHAACVVHRDLKPANLLWRPRHHAWTLIDYGCAAEIGTMTRLTFSMAYSPPETLCALYSGARSITSDPASDIWAIGVITYELVLGRPAFPARTWTREQLTQAAMGERAYPWEVPNQPGRFRLIPEARAVSSALRACLNRDATRRPSAATLGRRINQLFDDNGATSESSPCKTADAALAALSRANAVVARDRPLMPTHTYTPGDGARVDPWPRGQASGEQPRDGDADSSHPAATDSWLPSLSVVGCQRGTEAFPWPSSIDWTSAVATESTTEGLMSSSLQLTGRTRHIFHDQQGDFDHDAHGDAPPSQPGSPGVDRPAAHRLQAARGAASPPPPPHLAELYRSTSLPGTSSADSTVAETPAAHARDLVATFAAVPLGAPRYGDVPPALLPTSLEASHFEHDAAAAGHLASQPPGSPPPGIRGSSFSEDRSSPTEDAGSFLP